MKFDDIKQRINEYIKQDVESYRDKHTLNNTIPVMCNSGTIIQVMTFEELDGRMTLVTNMDQLKELVMNTLNFQWSASFEEVCEYAGINDVTGNCV